MTDFRGVPGDGDDSDEIDERFAVLAVVDDRRLDLATGLDVVANLEGGATVDGLISRSLDSVWVERFLQEPTVLADDLIGLIASEQTEAGCGKDDG